ncbi:MAG: hypothetical protein KGL39_12450 [Patescibacteria group bacterium]|nr:hypothetical protein [Patescibacteria group bacterium]
MILFQNDQFIPGDERGFGLWRSQHYYEHVQFNLLARDLASPAAIPEFDILSWVDAPAPRRLWLIGHYDMHQVLRQTTGVSGIDLSEVDWDNPMQVFVWLENHAAEHDLMRQAFGITA